MTKLCLFSSKVNEPVVDTVPVVDTSIFKGEK